MKRYILSFLILGAPALLFAQLDSFDLAAYKLPIIFRHQLDFNLAGSGNNSYNRSITGQSRDTSFSNAFTGGLGGTYSFYGNSARYQGEQSVSFSMTGSISKSQQSIGRLFNSTLYVHSLNRSYVTKKQFIEYGLDLTQRNGLGKTGWTGVFSWGNYTQLRYFITSGLRYRTDRTGAGCPVGGLYIG